MEVVGAFGIVVVVVERVEACVVPGDRSSPGNAGAGAGLKNKAQAHTVEYGGAVVEKVGSFEGIGPYYTHNRSCCAVVEVGDGVELAVSAVGLKSYPVRPH